MRKTALCGIVSVLIGTTPVFAESGTTSQMDCWQKTITSDTTVKIVTKKDSVKAKAIFDTDTSIEIVSNLPENVFIVKLTAPTTLAFQTLPEAFIYDEKNYYQFIQIPFKLATDTIVSVDTNSIDPKIVNIQKNKPFDITITRENSIKTKVPR